MKDELNRKVIAFVAQEMGEKISPETRLQADLGMDGDDAVEFFERYSKEFNVDLSAIEWEAHFGPEKGFNPLLIFSSKFWRSEYSLVPVTVQNLIDSAHFGKWQIKKN